MKKSIFTFLIASATFIGFGQNQKLHRVEAKETFYSIARLYRISPIELMKANSRFGPSFSLKVNDKIAIDIAIENDKTQATLEKQKRGKRENQSNGVNKDNVHYTYKSQTLANISTLYKISISRLMKENNIASATQKLSEGIKIILPDNVAELNALAQYNQASIAVENKAIDDSTLIPASYFKGNNQEIVAIKSSSPETSFLKLIEHQVQKKETLLDIGNRYGVLITKIMELNKLQTMKLKPGQRIFIDTEWVHPHTASAKLGNTTSSGL